MIKKLWKDFPIWKFLFYGWAVLVAFVVITGTIIHQFTEEEVEIHER